MNGTLTQLRSEGSFHLFLKVWFVAVLVAAAITLTRSDGADDYIFHALPTALWVVPSAFALFRKSSRAARLVKYMSWFGVFGAAYALNVTLTGGLTRVWGGWTSNPALPATYLVAFALLSIWGTLAVNKQTAAPLFPSITSVWKRSSEKRLALRNT